MCYCAPPNPGGYPRQPVPLTLTLPFCNGAIIRHTIRLPTDFPGKLQWFVTTSGFLARQTERLNGLTRWFDELSSGNNLGAVRVAREFFKVDDTAGALAAVPRHPPLPEGMLDRPEVRDAVIAVLLAALPSDTGRQSPALPMVSRGHRNTRLLLHGSVRALFIHRRTLTRIMQCSQDARPLPSAS